MVILKFSVEEMCKTNQFHACPCSEAFNSEDFYEFHGIYWYELFITLKNSRKNIKFNL